MIQKCHICKGPGEVLDGTAFKCFRCGRYIATKDSFSFARAPDEQWDASTIANASGWLADNQGVTLDKTMLSFLSSIPSQSVATKADKLLRFLSHKYPSPGFSIFDNLWIIDKVIKVSADTPEESYRLDNDTQDACRQVLPYLSGSWAKDQTELHYLIFTYLQEYKQYLKQGRLGGSFMITPAGWDHLASLQNRIAENNDAFVAMWFDSSMNSIWASGIVKGIRAAGYNPIRIDKKEHNNKIDDEIIASIRRSRFLVADFTGHRGGVYFEAGLAAGFGKQVVWICRNTDLKDIHFDTRQYNFILWDVDKPNELAERIQNRIEATIGRGTEKA